ncbi:hypothetical protein ACX0HA_11915 [Flavobacterium hauense]
MKKQLLTLSFALCAALGYSQIQSETSNSSTWPSIGKVGIGTTSPAYKLHVSSNSTLIPVSAYVDNLANFGTRPTSGLRLQAKGYNTGSGFEISVSHAFRLQMTTSATAMTGYIEYSNPATTNTTKSAVSFGHNDVELMRINENGKVRIGLGTNDIKTPNGYKLFVEEGILTEKVKVAVKTTTDWADYVFAPDYKLMPLDEVAAFTKANKHLPNVLSAEQMVEGGLDVAKMDAKLLEKIEELTLYIIDQDDNAKQLKAEFIAQKKEAEDQKSEIEELKAQVKLLMAKQ